MPLAHRSRDRADVMLPEISREARSRGRAFSLTLLASAIGLIALSWDDIWRVRGAVHGDCVERSAGAVILTLGPYRQSPGASASSFGSGADPSIPRGAPGTSGRSGSSSRSAGSSSPEDPRVHVRSWPFRRRARRVHASAIDLGGHELAAQGGDRRDRTPGGASRFGRSTYR